MNEDTIITICLAVIVLAATSCGMYGCHQVESTYREYAKQGLVQKQGVTTQTVWVKP